MKTTLNLNFDFNSLLGIVGLIGVWVTTHNGWAVFWAFIGALHFSWRKHNQ